MERTSKNRINNKFLCKCDCGKEVIFSKFQVLYGKHRSYGCKNTRFKDLIGLQFGNLSVVSRAEDTLEGNTYVKHIANWNCVCMNCGKQLTFASKDLRMGLVNCCGEPPKKDSKFKQTIRKNYIPKPKEDLTGRTFGKLTVIGLGKTKYDTDDKAVIQWRCQCTCGNIIELPTYNLKLGRTTSCGCAHKREVRNRVTDLTGMQFGKLTVLGKDDYYSTRKDVRKHLRWKCQCECGNITYVSTMSLRHNRTLSCGCAKSKMELETGAILKSNHVKHKYQVTFEDCLGSKGGKLSFDFGIYDKDGNFSTLIECQGLQHYEPVGVFGGEEQFKKQLQHDSIKREFCRTNNYKLIELPYQANSSELIEELLKKESIIWFFF